MAPARSMIVIAGLAVATACAAPSVTGPGAPGAPPTSITVSEQPCFGFCPVYSITISPDGHYVLDGQRFTRRAGRTEGQLPADRYDRMITVLRDAGFSTIPSDITPGSEACGNQVATDLPTLTVETGGEAAHRVVWYPGCRQSAFHEELYEMRDALRAAFDYGRLVVPPAPDQP